MSKKEAGKVFLGWLLNLPAFKELDKYKQENIIHVLHEGHALCGFPGRPRDWPLEHKWVSSSKRDLATCARCLEALHKASMH